MNERIECVERLREQCRQANLFRSAREQWTIVPVSLASYTVDAILGTIDALTTENASKDQERKDLAMLVRRLCFALNGTKPKLQEQAYDYLIRKGLQGDILRGEDNATN